MKSLLVLLLLYVIDGDTLVLDGVHIRLRGIDAPERHQLCDGHPVGEWSRTHLTELIGNDPVTCRSTGHDKYGRTIGLCTTPRVDLNRQMVVDGYAIAYRRYSLDYVNDETGRGPVHVHHCANPETWRHTR